MGTPQEVYDKPATTFVATFIGSPQMNLIPGTVRDGIIEAAGGLRVPAPKGLKGKALVGVRPEHFSLQPIPGAPSLEGRVDFVERLGSDTIIHVEAGDVVVVARFSGDLPVDPRGRVRLYARPGKIRIFDEQGRLAGEA